MRILLLILTTALGAALSACNQSAAGIAASTTATSRPVVSPTAASTATASPVPTATSTATPAPTVTATATPQPPTATPAPALRQLTSGGCCVQPFFSPDGRQVMFIDQPAANAPAGIYGLPLTSPPATPVLVSPIIGFRSPDGAIVGQPAGDLIRFTREATGQNWVVDTAGNQPYYNPRRPQIVWTATDQEGPYDRRQSDLWLADLDGSNARELASVYGGGFAGWLPNGESLLITGRDQPADEEVSLRRYDLADDRQTELFRHKRLRGVEISPGGRWLVIFLTFSDDPADDGLWLVSADGQIRQKLSVPGFGAYRWRNEQSLLYIPMRNSIEESMQIWMVEVPANQSHPLTNPAAFSFSIANGDWDVSPDGNQLIFVNSADQNIWLISLPPE